MFLYVALRCAICEWKKCLPNDISDGGVSWRWYSTSYCRSNHLLSVTWHYWLGHQTCKTSSPKWTKCWVVLSVTLTLWRPLLSYGYSYKASCAVIGNFWHPGTLTLRTERQSAKMSKTEKRLNPFWHRVLYSCTHVATVGVKVLNLAQHQLTYRSDHWFTLPCDVIQPTFVFGATR